MRAHIIVPEELILSVDKLVGPRSRSKFFVEAAEERINKIKRAILAKKLAGSLKTVKTEHWETSNSTYEWIRNARKANEKRLKYKT